jgi:WD40 repeat protein
VRLKNWVDDESEAVQMYLRLAEAAGQYQVGKAGLWRPPDLQLALNWQAKHKPTLVWGQRYHPAFERTLIFLEYSKKEFDTEQRIKELEQKRKLQRARVTAIVFGTLAGIALIAFVYAFVQQAEAKKQQFRAEELAIEAKKNADEAIAERKKAEAQRDIADRARREAEDARKAEEIQKQQAELRRLEAEKAKAEADRQRTIADANAVAARKAEGEATVNAERATKNAEIAQRERYLAIASRMAIKSKELGNDPEQEALVAQQAYLFNKKFNGYPYNSDIYSGLYYALKNNNDPLTLSLEAHKNGAARALETHGKGNHIYSGGSDGQIIRWSYANNKWNAEIIMDDAKRGGSYLVFTMDTSPDGNLLAAGGLYPVNRNSNYIELYDLNNISKGAKKITGFISDIENIHFTPDGKGLYARDNSGFSIRYSDLSTAKEVISSKEKIVSLDLNENGTMLAGAGVNGNLYLWDIGKNYSSTTIKMPKGLSAVKFAPDGRQVVVGDRDGVLYLISNGIPVRTLAGHSSQIEDIDFNHAGSFMATASKDHTVRLWNFKELNQQPILLSDHDWAWSVAFTPDDSQLMVGINTVRQTATGVDQTIHAYPTNIDVMKDILCNKVGRNMSQEEWDNFVAKDLDYEKTCENYPGARLNNPPQKKGENKL